jgi:hypothetical protein
LWALSRQDLGGGRRWAQVNAVLMWVVVSLVSIGSVD